MKTRALGQFGRVLPVVFVLASLFVEAQEPPTPTWQPVRRNLYLSKDPDRAVPEVFVAARTVTTLRFELPCDPARTRMLGWEGRFEPLLVGGGSVVIVPLRELAPDDRFMLVVTLTDGTSLPFTVTAAKDVVDGQIDVFPDSESPEAVRVELRARQAENRSLRAENWRYRREETSVEHALATLLANNETALTPFRVEEKWRPPTPELDAEVSILLPKGRTARGRAAVVFQITNLTTGKPWTLQEARLMDAATLEKKPFALRASAASIAPGETGRIAIVMDLPPPESVKTGDMLVLELFGNAGLRQGYVELDLSALAARVRR
ncbi:DUF2381 family protein [Archangium violaceum]|uniref:DUF2381 family protein n=1 Tax=Archangium violaceum TaxID=83451 RepID=UPI001951D550|nr:DUF2381 family protein [Archangium violaceum]QRN95911.1 DUF2381 family protein [Archangium violaceum]